MKKKKKHNSAWNTTAFIHLLLTWILQVLRGGDGNIALFLLKTDGVEYDILQKTDQNIRGGFQYGPFKETGNTICISVQYYILRPFTRPQC